LVIFKEAVNIEKYLKRPLNFEPTSLQSDLVLGSKTVMERLKEERKTYASQKR
jgi:hypothetical protein